jgi:hypothetical protein
MMSRRSSEALVEDSHTRFPGNGNKAVEWFLLGPSRIYVLKANCYLDVPNDGSQLLEYKWTQPAKMIG